MEIDWEVVRVVMKEVTDEFVERLWNGIQDRR